MLEHMSRSIRVGEVAAVAGLSPFHFTRVFKKETGLAPYAYLTQIRLDHARSLLTTTSMPIGHIAQLTGFRTQAHFTAIFKRGIGMPPGKYRDAHAPPRPEDSPT